MERQSQGAKMGLGKSKLGPELLAAAGSGDTEQVRSLHAAGAHLEAVTKKSESALFLAAKNGHTDTVKACAELGSNLEATNVMGWTALTAAVKNGHEDVVRLLAARGANLETVADHSKQTPIWIAAEWGRASMVKTLAELGANINAADNNGRTPLWIAASKNLEMAVCALAEMGADLQTPSNKDFHHKNGQMPLEVALEKGNDECANALRRLIAAAAKARSAAAPAVPVADGPVRRVERTNSAV